MITGSDLHPVPAAAVGPDGTAVLLCRDDFPEIMVEEELIQFLRIPAVSKAQDYHHVIEHLKRMRGLPCFYIARQPLYFQPAIREWIQRQVDKGRRR